MGEAEPVRKGNDSNNKKKNEKERNKEKKKKEKAQVIPFNLFRAWNRLVLTSVPPSKCTRPRPCLHDHSLSADTLSRSPAPPLPDHHGRSILGPPNSPSLKPIRHPSVIGPERGRKKIKPIRAQVRDFHGRLLVSRSVSCQHPPTHPYIHCRSVVIHAFPLP